MPSLEDRLAAGLLAQDWDETASRSSGWRRFGKFGRGAQYIIVAPDQSHSDQDKHCLPGELWFSELHESYPRYKVVGPILEQILLAGDKVLKEMDGERADTEAMLIELMFLADGAPDAEA